MEATVMQTEAYPGLAADQSLLLTDLYELNMMQAYLEVGMTESAVFEFFVRHLPRERGFLMAAGLAQVVAFLEGARFTPAELEWLRASGRFSTDFIDYLADFRFTGALHAMPEGTVFFANEPIVRVTAPLPEAQLFESRIINLLHFQTLIASKAARMVLAAPNKLLIDFGLRRAHGAEAGLLAARASYLAGFAGTATALAAPAFGIPIYGTMAHSFVQAFDSEEKAFEAFAQSRPDNLVLLLDTYDTEAAAQRVVDIAPRLVKASIALKGVRLDSGDLAQHAREVRAILDQGGLKQVSIFASGGLDELTLQDFHSRAIPIDGFGIGTSLTTSSDVAALDCAYKLQEYAGLPKRKRSEGKATLPGAKQVYRSADRTGMIQSDVISLEHDPQEGIALIEPVMAKGQRIATLPLLDESRKHAAENLASLPQPLTALIDAPAYPVTVSVALQDLAAEADRLVENARRLLGAEGD